MIDRILNFLALQKQLLSCKWYSKVYEEILIVLFLSILL